MMKTDLVSTFLGGAVVGLVALAMDYFFLQHFFRTPIARGGAFAVVGVLLYLLVPSIILLTSGNKRP